MPGVLIVDDSSFMRTFLSNIVRRAGLEVADEAVNGLEAIKKYKSTLPDLVIMDISMEVLNGLDALKQIKQMDPAANVIICTAAGNRWNIEEALQSGAKDFIVKPLSVWKVMESIQKVLRS